MTNQEINKRIAELYLPCDYIVTDDIIDLVSTVTKLGAHGQPYEVVEKYGEFNPAENWNHLMPLVIQHNISHYRPKEIDSDIWIASKYNAIKQEIIEAFHFSPQMALCMCLIKVLEAEKENTDE